MTGQIANKKLMIARPMRAPIFDQNKAVFLVSADKLENICFLCAFVIKNFIDTQYIAWVQKFMS